jgi:alpha-tubulin suppressor-like RCC1 family protein
VPISGIGVAAGDQHTCALLNDRRVRCWGQNDRGQLGDGTVVNRLTPVTVSGLAGVSAIAVGGKHTCALQTDGAVWCWGWNNDGQLGNGTGGNTSSHARTPVAVGTLPGVLALAAGGTHTCAVLRTHRVACWGEQSPR